MSPANRCRKSDSTSVKISKDQMTSLTDDLICPISLELPCDPVIAEDGRIYDRPSIEEHFQSHRGDLKSPITNEQMGIKLLPAVQHRNTIETLVAAGVIWGDLAAKWIEKVKEKKDTEELLKKANSGNADAMYEAGARNFYGLHGFKQDFKLGIQWYTKAHRAGNVRATVLLGGYYLNGFGVTKCCTKGMVYMSVAAGQGSNIAAYTLGMAFANGRHGFNVDKAEAIHWLGKATEDSPHDCLSYSFKHRTRVWIDQLKTSKKPRMTKHTNQVEGWSSILNKYADFECTVKIMT
ncbi:Sel1 domain protein repeat-containing protein [Seminavis robusta]|uniref:Sel1 domain protein repeat-containing protein n=1 Tax=Seminavis robusta TaxID=568900 RepID=A0A9N8EVW7_9STRA|nr:Sel1 domain protein repeat-containing protein [Seminavis robusta]|eukprot:Sro2046_g312470.1 Sel1 domain protein repeat-containing protein (293) ;mRNA; r:6605-7483